MGRNKAFTLIEILVAIIIIGILTTLAIPRYVKTVELARITEAQAMLSALRKAEMTYYLKYDTYFYFLYGNYTDVSKALDIDLPAPGLYRYGCYNPPAPGVYAQKLTPPYVDGRIRLPLPPSNDTDKWCFFSYYGGGNGSGVCYYDAPQL